MEFHGTGTKAGDPIEMGAVARSIAGRSRTTLYGGSAKTQLGHTEAAAGLAGLVRCILAMENGLIPPHLNFIKPNRRLGLGQHNIILPTSPQPWPECQVLRCSVNSFGFGGTNAHVIVDDGRSYLLHRNTSKFLTNGLHSLETATLEPESAVIAARHRSHNNGQDQQARIFVLSAPDRDAVTRQRLSHANYILEKGSNDTLGDLAYTLAQRRSVFQWRHAVVASSVDELEQRWREDSIQAVTTKSHPNFAFIFTGQGAQWHAMGQELIMYVVYANSVKESATCLASLGCPWNAWDEFMSPETSSSIYLAEYSQPLCTVLQIALVDLLTCLGIRPSAVIGHSSGEIAAAYAAGALGRLDCLKIAYYRGIVSQEAQKRRPGGGMMAVGLSAESVGPYLVGVEDSIAIGCVNSPISITLTGDKIALQQLQFKLQAENISYRLLQVDNAYHSAEMIEVGDKYLRYIGHLDPKIASSGVTYYSTVYGKQIPTDQLLSAYWVRNLCSPVEFVSALDDMMYADVNRLPRNEDKLPNLAVEIGPHAALSGPIKQFKAARNSFQDLEYGSLLVRGRNASHTLLAAVSSLRMHGVPVSLDKVRD